MSFELKNLGRVGSGTSNAGAIWSYSTDDGLSAVKVDGYFNEAKTLRVKDYIIVLAGSLSAQYKVTATSPDVTLTEVVFSPPTGDNPNYLIINQSSHGFSLGQVLYYNTGTELYDLAKADAEATAKALGFVAAVLDDDNFVYTPQGFVVYGGVPSPGDQWYLSATNAGGVTATPPSSPNYIVPIFQVHNGDYIYVHIQYGTQAAV